MCWDVTVICPLAESYVNGAANEAGAAAEVAASRKEAKYAGIDNRYVCETIAVESLDLGTPMDMGRVCVTNLVN